MLISRNFCESKSSQISALCETVNSNFLSTSLNIFVLDVVENLQKEDVLIERQEEGKNFFQKLTCLYLGHCTKYIHFSRKDQQTKTNQARRTHGRRYKCNALFSVWRLECIKQE